MAENKNARTSADGPDYERGFIDGMQRQMQLHVNRVIKTWNERCEEHPDHQHGMISESMIQARMQEEIDELRQALETEQEPVGDDRVMTVVYRNVQKEDAQSFTDHPKAVWFGWCHAPYQRDDAKIKLEKAITSPPASKPWVGLTDDAVFELADTNLYDGGKNYGVLAFAKAIEQALKEKNT